MMKAIGKLLTMRGVHFFATRFGPSNLKKLAFDEKFRNGDWKFSKDGTGELAVLVNRHAANGDLLIMGCGGAAILEELKLEKFSSVLGVDLSSEAIDLAQRYAASNVAFQQADMVGFQCSKPYDAILFSESLYYVPFYDCRGFLDRLCKHLKPAGCIIVTVAQPRRHHKMIAMIRQHFTILEDRQFPGSERHLITFSSGK
jgi:2-polyprenyl-3-methyl-5-hydroxy-6-metoxy-1,4-benzoquinol methylase